MEGNRRRKLIAAVVAVVAVAGGGAAIAATQIGSPKEESQAIINDAAKQLGVQPSALSDALKTALKNRVDAAVAGGALTKAEGDAIKARVDSGEFPLVGAPFGHLEHHLGPFGPFAEQASVAAKYLGLTTSELASRLAAGRTLAQIAKDQNKSVDGLVQALYDSVKAKADAAVKAGRITKDEEQSLLSGVRQRITDLVNGRFPALPRPHFGHRHFGGGWGFRHGPPAFLPPPTS